MDASMRQKLEDGQIVVFPTPYGKMPMSKEFVESSKEVEIDTGGQPLEISCPVRIIHGAKDDTVSFRRSLDLLDLIKSPDIDLIIRKNGDHRMSKDEDLELIGDTINKLVNKVDKLSAI